uniref:Uncharacterized protein n=1 Tax=Neolamprologus brichardi TaxID=32507 RepID=A0A3Q4G5N7_NEOBR
MFSNSFSGALPLASLRLMASPLQLTYSYIWQVVRQKNVKHIVFRDMPFTVYNMVEHFFSLNRKCSLFSMAQSLTQRCRL